MARSALATTSLSSTHSPADGQFNGVALRRGPGTTGAVEANFLAWPPAHQNLTGETRRKLARFPRPFHAQGRSIADLIGDLIVTVSQSMRLRIQSMRLLERCKTPSVRSA